MLELFPPPPPPLYSASSVSCLGQEFQPEGIVCLQRPSDTDFPVFAEIVHVIVTNDLKYLAVNLYTTDEFSHHYFAYKVFPTACFDVLPISKLALHQVYHRYQVHSEFFVVVKSCDHVELFV